MRGDRFHAPTTLDEAWTVLETDRLRCRIVGGGTWIVPALQSAREAVTLVSLRRLPLSGIQMKGETVSVGAMTNYDLLVHDQSTRNVTELLHLMALGITGGRQLRIQGTIGGSVMAARPQSDVPCALAALSATLVLASPRGERRLAFDKFFVDAYCSAADPDEILTAVEFAADPAAGHGYVKIKGAASSWPIVTGAAKVALGADGKIETAAVAVGGATATPFRVDLTRDLHGTTGSAELLNECIRDNVRVTAENAWQDVLAPGDYRAAVSPVAARRALASAIECANRKVRV
ncbi:FAD binding domain-containing protein [Nocardia sp. NPDC059246]|uniref:FAD binding domain-containing protein n=1 Tax=unclassified Nocardia TaxID=2637762 RepID=UPI003676FFE0